nr:integrase, catalytic region, zinc finger, CCHC-type, peptidase aspartic, catalytic [Tanacetum cinerariifolium]
MEQAVEQHRLESKLFEIKMNQVLNEYERLLQLYDSIKPTLVQSKEQCDALINQVNQKILKGKALVDNVVTTHTIAPEILKVDVEPIGSKLLNNRTVHSDYLRHTQEQDVILREVVKQVKSQNPLNNSLDHACNTMKDKMQRPPSSTQKNNVEAHPKTIKSSLKNKNCAIEPKGTTIVKHSKLNANSELICVKCNGCMLLDNHDLWVLNIINDVNAHPKSKSIKKTSKRKVWKPTGKVFTKIEYTWRPTGRTFSIVGNVSPLTRITTTAEVPLRKPTALETDTPKPVATLVYSRKPRKSKTSVPVSKPKIIKSISANNTKPRYGDYQIGNVTISRVYYKEGLRHNLFSVGKFCDSNLKVAFREHTCFIRNLEEPVLHEMTPVTISLGLVPNPSLSTPVDPPVPEVIALITEVVAPETTESTGSPSSTTIDQDAPSPSNSQTTSETQSSVISNDIKEENHDLDIAHMNNDPFFGTLTPENDSESSSSDVISTVVHCAAPNSEQVTE